MFHLESSNATIINLNLRAEKHGDENQPACDIKVAVDLPSVRLNDIASGLCESLYRKPAKGDQLPLVEVGKGAENQFTVLKHPGLEPLQLKHKFPGYELGISAPEAEDGPFFADAEVKNFKITPRDGGTATVSFSVGVEVNEEDVAALLPFLRNPDAEVTLTPPKSQTVAEAA